MEGSALFCGFWEGPHHVLVVAKQAQLVLRYATPHVLLARPSHCGMRSAGHCRCKLIRLCVRASGLYVYCHILSLILLAYLQNECWRPELRLLCTVTQSMRHAHMDTHAMPFEPADATSGSSEPQQELYGWRSRLRYMEHGNLLGGACVQAAGSIQQTWSVKHNSRPMLAAATVCNLAYGCTHVPLPYPRLSQH